MITLTIREIIDLAKVAGLNANSTDIDQDDMETEITIKKCPMEGVIDPDTETIKHYKYVAYHSEIEELGVTPLGDDICGKCGKKWSDHDFGVPEPLC